MWVSDISIRVHNQCCFSIIYVILQYFYYIELGFILYFQFLVLVTLLCAFVISIHFFFYLALI